MEAVQRQRTEKSESSSKSVRERLFYDHLNAAVLVENESLYLEDYSSGVKSYLGDPEGSPEEVLGEAAQESQNLDQLREQLDQESQDLEELEKHITM